MICLSVLEANGIDSISLETLRSHVSTEKPHGGDAYERAATAPILQHVADTPEIEANEARYVPR